MIIKNAKTIEIYKSIDGLEIKQCSRRQQSYKKHLHKELSIGLIERGSTVVDFGGEKFVFGKDDLIVIPPFLSHRCSPENINI